MLRHCDGEREMKEALTCIICKELASSPVHVSTCCRQVIGCPSCVQRWSNESCPHCRSALYETLSINCFESVLDRLRVGDNA